MPVRVWARRFERSVGQVRARAAERGISFSQSRVASVDIKFALAAGKSRTLVRVNVTARGRRFVLVFDGDQDAAERWFVGSPMAFD